MLEFLGLPGSGKTSLCREVSRSLTNRGMNVYTLEEAFCSVARRHIDKPLKLLLNFLPGEIGSKACLKMINRSLMQYEAQCDFLSDWGRSLVAFFESPTFASMSSFHKKTVISGYLQVGSLYNTLVKNLPDTSVVLFDEGFLQKSFMFVSHEAASWVPSEILEMYLSHVPMPNMAIIIRTSPATSRRRMLSRKKGPTRRLATCNRDEIDRFLLAAEGHLSRVMNWLIERTQVEIEEIDNNRSLSESVKTAKSKIMRATKRIARGNKNSA